MVASTYQKRRENVVFSRKLIEFIFKNCFFTNIINTFAYSNFKKITFSTNYEEVLCIYCDYRLFVKL